MGDAVNWLDCLTSPEPSDLFKKSDYEEALEELDREFPTVETLQ